MYIVGLNGSHKDDGNTAFLLKEVMRHLEAAGTECEIISVHKAINRAKTPFCVCCESPCQKACYKNTMLDETFDKISKADFVLVGSPVYFGSMSGQLKCFFDKTRAVRASKAWLGKPVAALSVGATKYGGQERTIDHIHSTALVLGMNIFGNSCMDAPGHFGVSAHNPANADTYAIKQCENLAKSILSYLKRT